MYNQIVFISKFFPASLIMINSSNSRLSAVQVGKALQDMGFQQYRTKHGRFWKLFERPASDIGNIVPDGVVPTEKDLPF